jgi:hypothetical protein
MMYRDSSADRLYVCPGCSSPSPAPIQGGNVSCQRCRTPYTLPDRSGMLASAGAPLQPPNNDMGRLAQLRVQDGRPRLVPPTLQAVLGGDNVQAGREQEALAIWQSLRARATAGDVAASEDLTILTLLMVQQPAMQSQPELSQALSESALDAAVLPRHKQEQLGRLVRLAAGQGNRPRAMALLSWMIPMAPELEADSEYRVAAAILATLDRDPNRVLVLLGQQKDAVPIADSLDPMASVFRANAFELLGNVGAAAQILRELPDPRMLELVKARFPALNVCAQSGSAYSAVTTQEASQRAAASAGGIGCLIGAILAVVGLVEIGVGVAVSLATDDWLSGNLVNGVIGVLLLVIGVVVVLRSRAKGKHAAWMRVNGIPLQARVVDAQRTGTMINDVPVYQFVLQVMGPHGPYASSFRKLVPEHQVAMLMGREVRVRANPGKLDEVILEE